MVLFAGILISGVALNAGTISFQVTPPDGGTTAPTGSQAYNVGVEVDIAAAANPGFEFVKWDSSATSARILNKGKANTKMRIFAVDNATVTAYFQSVETSKLTLTASPTAGGVPKFAVDGTVVKGNWFQSSNYTKGQYVYPTEFNNHYYLCTQGGVSMTVQPTWTTDGSTVQDIGGSTVWAASTPYLLNALVRPATSNGHYYRCINAGTSDAAVPVWKTDGTNTNDGTAVWQDMGSIVIWQDVGMSVTYSKDATVDIQRGMNAGYIFLGWTLVSGNAAISENTDQVKLGSAEVTIQANYVLATAPVAAILSETSSPTAALGSVWTAATAYKFGQIVYPTSANGHYYRCTMTGTSGAVQPAWVTDGTNVVDNTVTWTDIGYQPAFNKAVNQRQDNTVYALGEFVVAPAAGPFPAHYYRCEVAGRSSSGQPAAWPTDGTTVQDTANIVAWVASHAYLVGDLVQPATANGRFYRCQTAGTSGSAAPTWKTDGTNTTDNNVVWEDRGTIITWKDVGRNPFNVDETVTVAEQHTSGYQFLGWSLAAGSGQATITGNQIKLLSSNVSAVANYKAITDAAPATITISSASAAAGAVSYPDYDGQIWTANTAYALNDIIRPTSYASHYYKCTTAGTTAATEPVAWNTSGGTTPDGTAIWTDIGLTLTGAYYVGDWVPLTYTVNAGYSFVGWTLLSGNASIDQATNWVVLNDANAVQVQANYVQNATSSAATLALSFTPSSVIPVWTANTDYLVGAVIQPTVFANHYYECVTAGKSGATEPNPWNTAGGNTNDGSALWLDIGRQPFFVKNVPVWGANTPYAIGDFVRPTTFASHYYRCTVAGTSAATEPVAWNTTGATTNDGTAVWTDVGMNPFNIGNEVEISSTPINGYTLLGWTVASGDASVRTQGGKWYVKLDGAASGVVANYKANPTDVPATLTLLSNPAGGGLPQFDGIATWTANTNYSINAIVKPTQYAMHYYQCTTVAGVSGGTEPTWPSASGSTVNDGTAIWEEIGTTLPYVKGDNVGINQNANGIPAPGYYFTGWTLSTGVAAINDPNDPNNATVTLNDTAVVVTANYKLNADPVTLTVSVYPDTAGQVNQFYPGANSVPYGLAQAITASANPNYQFSHWEVSGSLAIDNSNAADTGIATFSASTLQAVFKLIENNEAWFTTSVFPDNAGYLTVPWQGSAKKDILGGWFPIQCEANTGYVFSHWDIVSGTCQIDNSKDNPANALIGGDSAVKAVFVPVENVILTLESEDLSKGIVGTWLGQRQYAKNTAIIGQIWANGNPGYDFAYWEVTGNIFVNNIYSSWPDVTIFGNASMKAIYTAVATCAVTLDVSPANSGKVVAPYQGKETRNSGATLQLDADANPGYRFLTWKVTSGSGTILWSAADGTGEVEIYGDTTATAIFEAIPMATLSLATSSLDAGTTNPWLGAKSVETNKWYAITAVPEAGFKFTYWTFSGSLMIRDQSEPTTDVYVWDDCAATANFVADIDEVYLTVGVSPDGAGYVTPYIGTAEVLLGNPFNIAASSYNAAEYLFAGWKLLSGDASFENASLEATRVTPKTNSSILAVFVPVSKVDVKLGVSPANAGNVKPWTGTRPASIGVPFNASAIASPNYAFKHWIISSGNIKINDADLANTTMTAYTAADVTAVFELNAPKVNLSLAVSQAGTGFIEPWMGTAQTAPNVPVSIQAFANPGYKFTCWSVTSGFAVIDDSLMMTTTAIPSGDATVTANFVADGDVVLTLALSPANSVESITPCLGDHKVKVGADVWIDVLPAQGYMFTGWTLTSGSAAIKNAGLENTQVRVNGTATITANLTQTTTGKFTIAVSPEAAGSIQNPHIGLNNIPVGKWFEINAAPAQGFKFDQWTVNSGDAVLNSPTASVTYAKFTTDSTVTAKFIPKTPAVLTVLSNPENAGIMTVDDFPDNANGVFNLFAGDRNLLNANANPGFVFQNWIIKAGDEAMISVQNLNTFWTYFELTGNATVTANFIKAPTANLTVALNTEVQGYIDVNIGSRPLGTTNVPVKTWQRIIAAPFDGFVFSGWTASAGAVFYRAQDPDTYVMLTADDTVTANFSAKSMAMLTLTTSAPGAGYTTPFLGVDKVPMNEWIAIQAIAYEGYKFTSWQVTSGTATLYHPDETNAWVYLGTDSVITANFAAVTTVPITVAVDPLCSANLMAPSSLFLGVNNAESGVWHRIVATPKDTTLVFSGWETSSGDAAFEDSKALDTYVKATTASVLTAKFALKTTAVITLTTDPLYAGSTNYFFGDNTLPVGEWLALNLTTTNPGFKFASWEVTSGSAIVENPLDDTTFVYLTDASTITAKFTVVPILSLLVYDSAIQNDFEYQVNSGEWTAMPYGPAYNGYVFAGYEILSGTIQIDEPANINSFIRMSTDAAVKANWTKAALAQIQMKVNQPNPIEIPGDATFQSTINGNWLAIGDAYAGQSVVIKANENQNYKFVNWTVEGQAILGNANFATTYLAVNGDCTVTANFAELPTAKLTMATFCGNSSQIPGTVQPASGFYRTDIPIQITATPNAGFAFVDWTPTTNATIANSSARSTYATLAGDATVTASFIQLNTLELNVMWNPKHAADPFGTTPEDIYYLASGERFDLAQQAMPGYTFTGWELVSGTATIGEVHNGGTPADTLYYVNITSNAVIRANFSLAGTAVLTAAVLPAQALAAGTIEQFKPGNHIVPKNTSIEITPVPNVGYTFSEWTVTGGAQVYTVPTENDANPEWFKDDTRYFLYMTADGSVTANFTAATTVALIVDTDDFAGGTIAGNYGIDNVGTYTLQTGTKIWIWLQGVNAGYTFGGWTISGTNNAVKEASSPTTYMTLESPGTLTAVFTKIATVPVSFDVSPKGAGNINPSAGTYLQNTNQSYSISATANPGFSFVQWTVEGGVTLNDITAWSAYAVYTAEAKLTATFVAINPVTLTLSSTPSEEAGTINCSNGATVFDQYGIYQVQTGGWWNITANENPSYEFLFWQGTENVVISDKNNISTRIYLTGDAQVTAVYQQAGTAELTLLVNPANPLGSMPGVLNLNGNQVEPGVHTVDAGLWIGVDTEPNFGWKFLRWEPSGDLDLLYYEDNWTEVFLAEGSSGTLTAVYQEAETAVMTMTYDEDMGWENEFGLGEHNVPKNEWFWIEAVANPLYRFKQWSIDANSQIAGNRIYDEDVQIKVMADSVVQAVFETATQVEISISANPIYAGNVGMSYGLTNFGIGKWTIDAGKHYWIRATPENGYKFVKWSYTGGIVVEKTFEGQTYLTASADGTLTAEYVKLSTCNLTVAVNPTQGLGFMLSTIPNFAGTGIYTVNVGESYEMEVFSYDTYYFTGWTTSGDVTIRMVRASHGCGYEITAAGDSSVTANFSRLTYAQLALSANPTTGINDISADAKRGLGTHSVFSNQWIYAEVQPAPGYRFLKWSTTDATKIQIEDPYNSATDIYLFDNADLTAELVEGTTAALTVSYDTAAGGTANLAQGIHNLTVGQWIWINAEAFDGYYFSGWTVTGGGAIYQNRCDEEEAFILLTADATLTAGFTAATAANLTLASTPNIGGKAEFWTNPTYKVGHGTWTVDSNKKYRLMATPYPNYRFLKWTPSDATKVTIGDSTAEETYFIMTGDVTISAEFSAIASAQITLAANPVNALYISPFDWSIEGGFALSKDYVPCEDPEWCNFRPGTYTLIDSKTYLIQVFPMESYSLKEWQITGKSTVSNVTSYFNWNHPAEGYGTGIWYYLHVEGDSTVTAVFEQRPTASLTVQISPEQSGKLGMSLNWSEPWDLDPAPVTVYTGLLYDISAYAADGYYFQGIIVLDGNAQIYYAFDEECFSKARISVQTDAVIRAVFAAQPPDVPYLTLAISNVNAGTLNPLAGTYPAHLGQQYSITATKNPGYEFLYWQADVPSNVIIGNVNSATTTATIIDDVVLTAVFTSSPIIPMKVMDFKSSLDSENVGSQKPKDGASIFALLDRSELDFSKGLKFGIDGWLIEFTTWTKTDPEKFKYYYENTAKNIKVTVKKDKTGLWSIKVSGSKLSLYKQIDPTNSIDVFLIVDTVKYVETFVPNDSTKFSYKPADKKTADITTYGAGYSKDDELVSNKNKTNVGGQNFAQPAGFDSNVRPIVMIDSAAWNIDVAPVVKGQKYTYKSDKSLKPYSYELMLDFDKKKFTFKSNSNKTGGLSRAFVELPDGSWGIVNALTFDFGNKQDGTVIGQYSWRIEQLKVKTKLDYKRK